MRRQTNTERQLNIIAGYVDIDDKLIECPRCDGEAEIRVATKRGRHYRNSVGPGMKDRPCPDCETGFISWREYGNREGVEAVVDLAVTLDAVSEQAAGEIREKLAEV